MKISHVVLILFMLMSASCSAAPKTITGTVVDAETGKPIEGAIVLVEWTRSHGIGNTYTTSDKVVELLTDREGKFSLVDDRGGYPPDVTVYKKNYVAWSSRWIFPDWRNRTDFKWGAIYTYKLEQFKNSYSHINHTSFIRSSMNSSMNFEVKKGLYSAFSWEDILSSEEMNNKERTK